MRISNSNVLDVPAIYIDWHGLIGNIRQDRLPPRAAAPEVQIVACGQRRECVPTGGYLDDGTCRQVLEGSDQGRPACWCVLRGLPAKTGAVPLIAPRVDVSVRCESREAGLVGNHLPAPGEAGEGLGLLVAAQKVHQGAVLLDVAIRTE